MQSIWKTAGLPLPDTPVIGSTPTLPEDRCDQSSLPAALHCSSIAATPACTLIHMTGFSTFILQVHSHSLR